MCKNFPALSRSMQSKQLESRNRDDQSLTSTNSQDPKIHATNKLSLSLPTMQQRSSASSSSRGFDEGCVINVVHQPHVKHSPKRRMDDTGVSLPLYNLGSPKRPETSRSRSQVAEKWIHVIPVILLLCFFTLWWFSYPVNITFKDGKITSIHRIERSATVNDTKIDLLVLAVATSPIASVPVNLISNYKAEALLLSKTD